MLDLASVPPTSTDVLDSRLQAVETITQLPKYVDNSSIEFYVEPSQVECIVPNQCFLVLKQKVVKLTDAGEEKDLEAQDQVAYINNIGSSLFKSIDITYNDENITPSHESYHAYESYLNALLYLTRTEQRHLLDSAGWALDKPAYHSVTDMKIDQDLGDYLNPGLGARHKLARKTSQITTPILHSIFMQRKVLPTKSELKLKLNMNTSDFCLIADKYDAPAGGGARPALPRYLIKLEQATLYLRKIKLSPSVQLEQERMLGSPGKYPMLTNLTSTFILDRSQNPFSKTISVAATLPRQVFVFMTKKSLMNDQEANPFALEDFKVSEIFLEKDGVKYPSNLSYQPKYDGAKAYGKEFAIFKQELGGMNNDMAIDEAAFDSGYTIYAFNLTSDKSSSLASLPHNHGETGNLSLHIRFSSDLTSPVTVFVMSEFLRVLEIDSLRRPKWSSTAPSRSSLSQEPSLLPHGHFASHLTSSVQ